jgi:hypothetical protein
MANWNDMPKKIGRDRVLAMINPEGGKHWRNPAIIEHAAEGWPRPQSPLARERADLMSLEKSITGKSPF